jgi:hypothetical protein
MMESKGTYLQMVEEQVKEWKTGIDTLTARADKAEAQARIEYQKTLDNLKGKQTSAEGALKDLKEAGEESWEDLKKGFEEVREDMKESIKDAMASIS